MNTNKFPIQITEEDGPFNYEYIAVTSIPGIKSSPDQDTETKIFDFPELNSKTFIAQSCDEYYYHLDVSSALIYLMCTGFRGHSKYGKLSAYWYKLLVKIFGDKKMFNSRLRREKAISAKERLKLKKDIGSYLIYHASCPITDRLNFFAANKVGKIGFGFDMFPAKEIRKFHQRALNSTLTSLSLALVDTNASPDTHFIGDMIYLTGKNGLKIYSSTIKGGPVNVITSGPPDAKSLLKLKNYIPAMINDNRLETAISLYIQSQKKENDNLRSFIAAWSALELIINRLSKKNRIKWEKLLGEIELSFWDKDLKNVPKEKYRLRDRFLSAACVLDFNSVREDTDTFIQINNMRNGFYHRMTVKEEELPTEKVLKLFQKYLILSLPDLKLKI